VAFEDAQVKFWMPWPMVMCFMVRLVGGVNRVVVPKKC
jgi:hypothetical protein